MPRFIVVDLGDQTRAADVRAAYLVVDVREPEQDGRAVVDDDLLARIAERLADDLDVFVRHDAACIGDAAHAGDSVAGALGVFAGVRIPVAVVAFGVLGSQDGNVPSGWRKARS